MKTLKVQDIGDYEIYEMMEETGGSRFYRGTKKSTRENVIIHALKTGTASPVEMAVFTIEYKRVANQAVEGVVRFIDRIETRDTVYLVLEDIQELPMDRMYGKVRPDLPVFLDIAVSAMEGLAKLHSKNIVHRNINPRSILIHPETRRAKLTNFGFITALTHENDVWHNPQTVREVLAYMSPEQTGHMNRPVDYRTDLYSMGCVLYELLTGAPPFTLDNPLEMIHAHIARLPLPPEKVRSEVPSVLSDIVLRLLAKNPEDRYQNGYGVLWDLKECLRQFKERNGIEHFQLGSQDSALQFNVPHILIGREKEVRKLMVAFERINKGGKELILVGGLPGIGKSALIDEIRKPVAAHKGYFCFGKYDQFTRDIPYSAVIQAFKGLIQQLLSEGDKRIAMWKMTIEAALGTNGKVMTDVIPGLEFIIGPQPDIPVLEPEEAKNRFNFVFQKFIGVFASQEHALVLFLDDLQWADVASLRFIEALLNHERTRFCLLICAYRSNETGPGHPFIMTVNNLRKKKLSVSDIDLGPISSSDANQLVSIAFRCSKKATEPLTEIIHQKTAGNPFFVIQFCKSLYDLGYLDLDPVKGLTWDLNRINSMQVTENVVDLMAERMSTLDKNTRETLTLCAAIGNQFDLETVAMVSGQSLEQCIEDLSISIRLNFITMNKDIYRFAHDRIQEAAYSLIPEEDRPEIHLNIGRNMYEKTESRDFTDVFFQIADHLNQGRELITDENEKTQWAELNLYAGDKARQATAYTSALAYFEHALAFLPENHWKTHYETSLSIHMKKLECQSLSLNPDAANETFGLIEQHVQGNVDIANAYNLMAYLYTIHVDFEKALRFGMKGMSLVGVKVPEKPGNLHVLFQLIKMRWAFGRKRVEDILEFPEYNGPEFIAYINLSVSTATVAFYVDTNLFSYLVIKGGTTIPFTGICESTPFALNAIGCILSSIGLYELGFRFGETSLKMMETFSHMPKRGRVLYLFSFFILHTRRHARHCIENFRKAFSLSLEDGDLIFSLHSISMRANYRIMLGDNIDDVLSEFNQYEVYQKESKDPFTWHTYTDTIQFCRCLKGLTPRAGRMDEEDFSEENALDYYRQEINLIGLFFFRLLQVKIRYIFGEYRECMDYFGELRELLKSKIAIGTMHIPEFMLYQSLVMAAMYHEVSLVQKMIFRRLLKSNASAMKKMMLHCPDNYRHKYLLIKAEIYRLKGKKRQAVSLYRQAAQSADEFGFTQNKALSNERLATYFLEYGDNDLAAYYMTEAGIDYQKAGYRAKIDVLEQMYPQLMKGANLKTDESRKTSQERIDMESVMKISHAITGEIVLDKLLKSIMGMAMKRAGAVRGFLFLENNGKFYVEVESDITKDEVAGLQSIPLEQHGGFAKSVVHYVAHTRNQVILGDAATMGEFTLDPYILEHQPRSILCMPVLNQGRLSAIIYFENALTANAFKIDHVEFLSLLLAQAAIAIDNARLYENLEEKVKVRTEELNHSLQKVENANRQIMGSLRYASMIQRSLLPDFELFRQYFSDSFCIWIPRDIVGGDIYHFDIVEDLFIMAVFDCTGHGVPGGFMTMIASSAFRRILKEEKEYNPSIILDKINEFVKTTLQQDKENASDDGMDVAVCSYSAKNDALDFAGARLALYVMIEGRLEKINGDRKSLGYVSSSIDADFTCHTIPRAGGKQFYLLTDGYIDQLCEPPVERLGSRRFKNLIEKHHMKPCDEQKEILLNALNLHKGNQGQTDDITVIGFRI